MERSRNMTDQEYIQAMGWLAGQKLKAFAELNAYGKTDEPGTALAGFEEEYGKAARKQAIIDVIIQALTPPPAQKKPGRLAKVGRVLWRACVLLGAAMGAIGLGILACVSLIWLARLTGVPYLALMGILAAEALAFAIWWEHREG